MKWNDSIKQFEDYLKIEDSIKCIVCGTNDLKNHDPHCPVPSGEK